jgi:hypothetical protein
MPAATDVASSSPAPTTPPDTPPPRHRGGVVVRIALPACDFVVPQRFLPFWLLRTLDEPLPAREIQAWQGHSPAYDGVAELLVFGLIAVRAVAGW